VRRRDAAHYQSVRYAPALFQERIPKKVELRVTVVGRKVFAAEIRSQEISRLHIDWRMAREYGQDRYYGVYKLPQAIAERCVRLVRALGLCFGAIDLIVTPDDQYVFLEVNPNGQWAFIESWTGLPIGAAIADLLIRGRV